MRLTYTFREEVILKTCVKAQRKSRSLVILFLYSRKRKAVVGQRQTPAILPLGPNPGSRCTEAGRASVSVWTDAESLAPIRIRTPDRPDLASSYKDYVIPATHATPPAYIIDSQYVC